MLQHSSNSNVNALIYWNAKFWSHTNWCIQNSIIQTSTTTLISISISYQLKHEKFNESQQIMQFTLNLDLSITTRSRDAATRHAKEQKKRRSSQKFTSSSFFVSSFISIEISAFYEYIFMTVIFQTSMKFWKSYYTINDRNEMNLNKQEFEIYLIIQSIIIQNSMIRTRLMFVVTFDASNIEKHTRSQMNSQQKLLQKNQEVWENQIFKYLLMTIESNWNHKNQWKIFFEARISFSAFFRRFVEKALSFSNLNKTFCMKWLRSLQMKNVFFFSTTIRINDEEKIRLHMREKIIKHNNRFLFKSLTKYACNAMQRKKWKFNFSHNISIFEKVQLAKDIKRAKKTKEKMNANVTSVHRIQHLTELTSI